MSESREGEKVRLTLEHYDAEGKRMYHGVKEWEGFNNYMANDFILAMTHGFLKVIKELNERKNRVSPSGDRPGKGRD